MTPELTGTTPVEPHAPAGVVEESSQLDVVRCGAELVQLSERFYGAAFIASIILVGLAALAALALVPLRASEPLDSPAPTVVVAAALLALVPVAVWRAGALYRLVRRQPGVELALVLAAAALIVYPLRSELWWPSCALLMLLGILVPLRRAMAYCAVVLVANLVAHLVAGDLRHTPAVAIIGLWIGYPLWTAACAVLSDRLARHVLLLNATRARQRPAPLRFATWTSGVRAASAVGDREPPVSTPGSVGDRDREMRTADAVPTGMLDRLTARQLQVVALLVDGLHYREVAGCLSISVRQVERHVAHAIARLDVANAYELVAVAVAERMVPDPTRPAPDTIERTITESVDARG